MTPILHRHVSMARGRHPAGFSARSVLIWSIPAWLFGLLLWMAAALPAAAQSTDALVRRYDQLIEANDYAAALAIAEQAEAIDRRRFGERHPKYVPTLKMIAYVYHLLERYDDAEQVYMRQLALSEQVFGANNIGVTQPLFDLHDIYRTQARYADADRMLQRALVIVRAAVGDNHHTVGSLLDGIGNVRMAQGRFSEAESLFRQGLAIIQRQRKPSEESVAIALDHLASLYTNQGRHAEAEALYKRVIPMLEKAYGINSSMASMSMNNLGVLYERQGRYAEAEALHRRVLAVQQQLKNDSGTGQSLNNLGNVLLARSKFVEAEDVHRQAVVLREKVYGAGNMAVAIPVSDLALVLQQQSRYADAEVLYRRALAIQEKTFGLHHPDVVKVIDRLARLNHAAGKAREAIALSRQATAALLAHAATESPDARNEKSADLIAQRGGYFRHHVANLALAAAKGLEPEPALGREALELAQMASQTSAASAVQKMSLRFAAGDGALSALVRQHQDLAAQWDEQDKALTAALLIDASKQNLAVIERSRGEMAGTERKLVELKARIEKDFPDYAALANPKPLKPEDLQKLLGPDEALVFWLVGDKDATEMFLFAVTREGFEWRTLPIGTTDLDNKVTAFRRGLDIDELQRSIDAGKPVLFDLALAHELYATLLGPVDTLIKNKKQLLAVPTGALTALPVHLLLTAKAEGAAAAADNFAAYRDASWLMKRQAVTVLPSVASLKALRAFGRNDQGSRPMVGFGDPVFGVETSGTAPRGTKKVVSRKLNTRSFTEFWQGAGVDRAALANALPRLEDTADELNAVAQKLGAPASDIFLRQRANEGEVKRVSLADYRVVYFATHGLVAGDVKGLAEPSLALTIPRQASEVDDGLLTASEIAQLKLNADWVVLSACNTISGDKPGAEALSGLARAFFYAGARALLVSHWAVESAAATRLTTSTFDILKSDPKLGRAEALRRAMLAYLSDTSDPKNAYPAYWAPFSIIGEGAAR